jgi:hypothetical protein
MWLLFLVVVEFWKWIHFHTYDYVKCETRVLCADTKLKSNFPFPYCVIFRYLGTDSKDA